MAAWGPAARRAGGGGASTPTRETWDSRARRGWSPVAGTLPQDRPERGLGAGGAGGGRGRQMHSLDGVDYFCLSHRNVKRFHALLSARSLPT